MKKDTQKNITINIFVILILISISYVLVKNTTYLLEYSEISNIFLPFDKLTYFFPINTGLIIAWGIMLALFGCLFLKTVKMKLLCIIELIVWCALPIMIYIIAPNSYEFWRRLLELSMLLLLICALANAILDQDNIHNTRTENLYGHLLLIGIYICGVSIISIILYLIIYWNDFSHPILNWVSNIFSAFAWQNYEATIQASCLMIFIFRSESSKQTVEVLLTVTWINPQNLLSML